LKGRQNAIIEILGVRFKEEVPAGVKKTLKAIEDAKQLKSLLHRSATVANLKEFQRSLPDTE
jgi:hypothetical protein